MFPEDLTYRLIAGSGDGGETVDGLRTPEGTWSTTAPVGWIIVSLSAEVCLDEFQGVLNLEGDEALFFNISTSVNSAAWSPILSEDGVAGEAFQSFMFEERHTTRYIQFSSLGVGAENRVEVVEMRFMYAGEVIVGAGGLGSLR